MMPVYHNVIKNCDTTFFFLDFTEHILFCEYCKPHSYSSATFYVTNRLYPISHFTLIQVHFFVFLLLAYDYKICLSHFVQNLAYMLYDVCGTLL